MNVGEYVKIVNLQTLNHYDFEIGVTDSMRLFAGSTLVIHEMYERFGVNAITDEDMYYSYILQSPALKQVLSQIGEGDEKYRIMRKYDCNKEGILNTAWTEDMFEDIDIDEYDKEVHNYNVISIKEFIK